MWKSTWSAINDRNFFELDWTLTRHNALLDAFVPNTFVGNHDVTRIASTLGPDGALAAAYHEKNCSPRRADEAPGSEKRLQKNRASGLTGGRRLPDECVRRV